MFWWQGPAAKPRPPVSLAQQDDIKNLDSLFKGWFAWHDMLVRDMEVLEPEADEFQIDLKNATLPPPPGVSTTLREWMEDWDELWKRVERLKKIKHLRDELLIEDIAAKQADGCGMMLIIAYAVPP